MNFGHVMRFVDLILLRNTTLLCFLYNYASFFTKKTLKLFLAWLNFIDTLFIVLIIGMIFLHNNKIINGFLNIGLPL
jgi:hypothetical protein